MITDILGSVLEVEKKSTSLYDVVKVARDVAEIIEERTAKWQRVIVNVSGGRKPQRFGALFGAHARKGIKRLRWSIRRKTLAWLNVIGDACMRRYAGCNE